MVRGSDFGPTLLVHVTEFPGSTGCCSVLSHGFDNDIVWVLPPSNGFSSTHVVGITIYNKLVGINRRFVKYLL